MQCRLSFMMKQYIEVYPSFHIVTSSSFHTKLVATKDLWLCKICLTYFGNTSPSEFWTRTLAWNTNMSKIFQSFYRFAFNSHFCKCKTFQRGNIFQMWSQVFSHKEHVSSLQFFTLWARSYTFKISPPLYKKNALFSRK